MPLRLYNTLTRTLEPFEPSVPGQVRMYVCGVTVYDLCHIGHARSALAFDVVRRYLEYLGYRVLMVRNFTDVDDKINNRARERDVPWDALAREFIAAFHADMDALGVRRADVEPKATDHIPEMLQIIDRLVTRGLAYPVDGDVYFAVRDFANYGKLSHRSPDDLRAGQQLDNHLRPMGLFFPVDPGADATFGGMASTRASGTNAVHYGTMSENILMLTVVLPNGEIITTGTRARKSSAGYDLTHLFIGAEETLGIITEVTLRIQGVPEAISAAIVSFGSLESAMQAVTQVRQIGVPIARIEFLDEVMVKAVNQFSRLTLAEQPTLFLEFRGSTASVKDNAEQVGEIMREFGGSDFKWAVNQAERPDQAFCCGDPGTRRKKVQPVSEDATGGKGELSWNRRV